MEHGLAVEHDACAGQDTGEHQPVERDGIQRVVVQNGAHELVLQHGRGGEEQAEHQEQEEDDRKIAVAEHLRLDVRAAQGTHAVDVDHQGHNGDDDARADLDTVQPVIIFSVDADENDGKEDDSPQEAAQPVDAVKGEFLHGPVRPCEQQDTHPHHKQHADDKPVHVAPVGPVADVGRHQARELDAFEHNDVDDGVEDREIARRSDAEAHVGEAFERAPHAEEPGNEAHHDEYGQAVDVQGDEVAGYQHRADGEEDAAGGEAELEPEEDRENQGHADERGVPGHIDIFLDAAQCAGHLHGSGQEHTSVELEDHGKKHGEEDAHGGGQEFFEVRYAGALFRHGFIPFHFGYCST